MKNILLIVADCARAEKTIVDVPQSSPGTRRSARLPFLESLRERGTTWSRFFAVSSTTTPNFAAMFTGLAPREHGIVEHSRHALRDVPTLAEILREHGYHTVAEVTGPLVRECGLDRGFTDYRWRDRSAYLHAGFGEYVRELLPRLDQPWFLCLHLWEAHAPYQNPPPFRGAEYGVTPYDRALSALDHQLLEVCADVHPEETTVIYCGDHGERLTADYELNETLGGDEMDVLRCYQRYVARHSGGFDFDAWFETARAELGEIPARIYAHNALGHGFHLTDELVHIPLVIVDEERCAAGATDDSLRSQVDFHATVLDLAGIENAAGAGPGRSLLAPPAQGGDPEMIYIEANGSGGKKYASRCYLRGARSREWKYWRVEGASTNHPVLWNLHDDPRETTNVAASHPDVVREMDRFTSEWLERGPAGAAAELTPAEEKVLEKTLRSLGYL
jgi:arylsulfatase A-like enzyme